MLGWLPWKQTEQKGPGRERHLEMILGTTVIKGEEWTAGQRENLNSDSVTSQLNPQGALPWGDISELSGVEARTGFALLLEADIGRGLPPREVGACTKPFLQLVCPDRGTGKHPVSTTWPLGHYIYYTSCLYLTHRTSFQHS